MSEENVEILRLFYEAFNRRAFDDVLQYLDPEVELYPGIKAPDQATRYRGHQDMKRFLEEATEAWETVTVEIKEAIELAGSRTLLIERWLFRGRDGIEIENELSTAYTVRNGLIVRIDGFTDKSEALEALGLSE